MKRVRSTLHCHSRVGGNLSLSPCHSRVGGNLTSFLKYITVINLILMLTTLSGCSCLGLPKSQGNAQQQTNPSLSEKQQHRPLLIVLSAPSGVGKSSLANAFREADPNVCVSVSVTTRPKRPAEVEGLHYHFVNDATFETMRARGDFIETALLYGKKYGTPKASVMQALEMGRDVVLVIDGTGAGQINDPMKNDTVKVFLVPPSVDELEHRLRARAQDSEESIQMRLAHAAKEMSYWAEYDYVIIARDLKMSLKTLQDIVATERMRRHRQMSLTPLVDSLIKGCQERSEGHDQGNGNDKEAR